MVCSRHLHIPAEQKKSIYSWMMARPGRGGKQAMELYRRVQEEIVLEGKQKKDVYISDFSLLDHIYCTDVEVVMNAHNGKMCLHTEEVYFGLGDLKY